MAREFRASKWNEVVNRAEGIVTKLPLQRADAQIKIEVTPVLRGCVFDPEMRSVRPNVEESFGFAETQVVSFAELYAGKIVAALTANILAIFLTSVIFWRMRASATI